MPSGDSPEGSGVRSILLARPRHSATPTEQASVTAVSDRYPDHARFRRPKYQPTLRLACLRLAAVVWPGGVAARPFLPGGTSEIGGGDVGRVPVQPTAIGGQEDRPVAALADGQVDCPRSPLCQRDGDHLAALADDDQGPVAALDAEGLDVCTFGFSDVGFEG